MANFGSESQLVKFYQAFVVEKVVVPSNMNEIIRTTDELCRDENIESLGSVFKRALPIMCAALFNSYKHEINEQRRKALKTNKTDAKAREPTNKITRESCVPKEYMKCQSPTAMAALTIYCLGNEKSRVRKNMLYAALSGEYKSVTEALRLFRNSRDVDTYDEPSSEIASIIIQTLLECSELVKDKSPAKLAYDIDEQIYSHAIKYYLEKQAFKTMYPFEPLKLKYLKGCVGQMYIKAEHDKLVNQHKVDPQRTIKFMMDNVDSASIKAGVGSGTHSLRKTRSAAIKFDTDQTYNVFVGPIKYLSNLMITNYKWRGRIYRIATYNDCLYDVMSSHLEDFGGMNPESDAKIYNSLPWNERLNLLPYRAKIELRTMTGDELNSFRGYATLAVSWMENSLECTKTVEVRSDKRRSQE